MNAAWYFENHPWQRACDCIQEQGLGDVVQVCVQAVCAKGDIPRMLGLYKGRMEALAGKEARGDTLETGSAVSYIGVYENGAIARFFFDDAADDISENFEIVTTKSLLVFKPNSTNQAHMLADGCAFIEASQKYVVDLEVK